MKAKHGEYIENPKCEICGNGISHKWLDGDYTVLICDNPKCLNEHDKIMRIELEKRHNIKL